MKQKEDRLRAKVIERKIYFDSDYVPQDFAYCDWSSDEEFREWLHSDRIIRKDILDEVLSDDDWLWKLALKYYPDNPEIVYADSVDGGVNWKREKLPKKKQYKQDVKED
jgi:isopentenyl phosphate kinase